MRESRVLEELEMFGSSQWGLVTAAQAHSLGIERLWLSRMNGRGMLQRIRHGVYALPSAKYDRLQDLRAAWLATDASVAAEDRLRSDDPVVVSHVSAAGVHQLGDLLAARHEFSSPARRQTTQKDLRFHRCAVPARDITWMEGLPVTSIARTVGDLAANATDFDHLATVVRDAVEDHHVSTDELAERLFPRIDDYGAANSRELVHSLLGHAGYAPAKDPTVTKAWEFLTQQLHADLVNPDVDHFLQQSTGAMAKGDLPSPARATDLKKEEDRTDHDT
ncbi:type IV toxin-antitoxin system AbiEi family antitoxin domain-containing protein [Corynebacterium sp. A21]|uniref:type IV toxin-antitoxin system AbiEi family antitoxin domain-containing protein n=1 Tax=Corynebacterium sp. A21 TaxID=3457318 RepID=UPI003FD54742